MILILECFNKTLWQLFMHSFHSCSSARPRHSRSDYSENGFEFVPHCPKSRIFFIQIWALSSLWLSFLFPRFLHGDFLRKISDIFSLKCRVTFSANRRRRQYAYSLTVLHPNDLLWTVSRAPAFRFILYHSTASPTGESTTFSLRSSE